MATARIAFKSVPDQELEFQDSRIGYLIPVCYEFAKTLDEEVYNAILHKKVSIYINDNIIKVDNWHTTIVKENDSIVITPNIEGENAGFLMAAIGVVLMVVAPYLGGPIWTGATLTWSTLAFSVGLSFVLGGLSNLLFQPDLPSSPSISSSKQTQTYNWSGIQTVARTDTPIPIVYGTHPVGGNIISLYTESTGDKSYLNMLIALCEGEIEGICQDEDHNSVCTTSDQNDAGYVAPAIKLDDQPLKFYSDVEWWYRKGSNTIDTSKSQYNPDYQNTIPGFDGARVQYDDGREVPGSKSTTNYIEYITTKDVDQVYLNFFVPQLYNGEGSDLVDESVKFKVQYSTDGVTYYDYEGAGTYKYEASVSGTRVQYCTCNSYRYGTYKYSFKEPNYIIRVTDNDFSKWYGFASQSGGQYNYTIKYDVLDANSNILDSREVKQSFYIIANWQGGEIFLDPPVYNDSPFYVGEYVVTLDHDVLPGDTFTLTSTLVTGATSPIITISGKTKTGIYSTLRLDFNESGMPGQDTYYIKMKRVDGGKSDSLKTANNLIFKSIIEIVDGAFVYPNTALLGLRILATGQLSGSPPNTVTLLKGRKIEVPDLSGPESFQDCFWDDTDSRWEYNDAERTWDNSTYTEEYSNNSILCVRDLVLSERFGLGEYYDSTDFDVSELVTSIRECWKRFDAYSGEDYLRWWDSGSNTNWLKWWDFNVATSTTLTKTYDSSARTITITGSGKYTTSNPAVEYLVLDITTITPLKKGQSYDLNITLSGVDYPVNGLIYGISKFGALSLGYILNKTNGTHTLTFTVPSADFNGMRLKLSGGLSGSPSYVISDISIVKSGTSFEHYHTWNGVLESGQSALTVLLEMCDAFRCWPVWHSGKINFVMDRDTTPIHTLSVGNTEKFAQTFTPLSELPYRIIGQFTDEARDYNLRSLVSTASVPDLIKINEKTIGLKGLTSKAKAERELKFKHGKAVTAVNSVITTCGVDLLHGTAGDIIYLQDDLPMWGHGGNILSYTATNFTIDTEYTFSNVATYDFTVRYQGLENQQLSATIDTTNISNDDSLQTFPLISIPASPCELSVFSLDTTSYQSKKFRIVGTNRTQEDKVEVSLLEHPSSMYGSESALTIIKESPLEPISPNIVPKAPTGINIVPLPPTEGFGFAISARPDPSDKGVVEIVVQLDRTGNREFETIGNLYSPNWSTTYSDSSLKLGYSYRFKLFCKTATKQGNPAEASCTIPDSSYTIPPPKGLRIKGATSNSSQFDGKDVTIIWDSIGLSTELNYAVKGYKINVYKNSISNANLLRTDFSATEEYTYTYAMNKGDNGTANGVLVFQLTTLTTNNKESLTASHITVTNSSPNAPSGLTSIPWMKGVQFKWNKNTETDLDYYSYRTKGIAGKLAYTDGTGTFTVGERLIQWNASGTVVASAVIDSANASYVYLSGITGAFEANKIIGEKSFGVNLITNGNMELDANWISLGTPVVNSISSTRKKEGTYSRRLGANEHNEAMYNQTIAVVQNNYYITEGYTWIATLTGGNARNFVDDGYGNLIGAANFTATGTWYNWKAVGKAQSTGNGRVFLGKYGGGSEMYAYQDDVSVKQITNAALADSAVTLDAWSGWNNITNTEVSRFLDSTELNEHPNETTIYIQLKAVDVYANESATVATSDITLGLNIKSTDIDNFAITSSKIFNKVPVITGDSWSDNTVLASEVQWNEHNLYYNGTLCVIASGHTSDKYIYWMNASLGYSTSEDHPASVLSDDDFIIAVNIDGTHDLAWNAVANEIIGSAYIQNLAVQTAHINNLAVTDAKINNVHAQKIDANTITASLIKGTGFGTLTLSSGKININTTDALDITASGSIRVRAGGNINMEATSGDISELNFVCDSRTFTFQGSYDNDLFSLISDTDGEGYIRIGLDIDDSTLKRPSAVTIRATDEFSVYLSPHSDPDHLMWTYGTDFVSYLAWITDVRWGSVASQAKLTVYADATDQYVEVKGDSIRPNVYFGANLGDDSYPWDEAYADNYNNKADFYFMDSFDDLAELHKIKGSGVIDPETNLELIDDNTLPEFLLAKKGNKISYTPKGDPYVPIKNAISHIWGCIKQLDNKFENFSASIRG